MVAPAFLFIALATASRFPLNFGGYAIAVSGRPLALDVAVILGPGFRIRPLLVVILRCNVERVTC
jgi:hypothetical protein